MHKSLTALKVRRPVVDENLGEVYDFTDLKVVTILKWTIALLVTASVSLVPALVILWLHHVNETSSRIYITIALTGALGLVMKAITNANMKEIFATTLAYASPS